jgi:CRP-like cAMP-binding protein
VVAVTIEDDIAFLARVPTFAKFGFAALQIVAIGSEAKHLTDGEILFHEGETTDAGYVIQTGFLKLTTNSAGPGDPGIRFGRGALIGELALLTETVCGATAVAVEPTTVIRISRNLFRKVLEGFPEAARLTRDRVAVRVYQSSGEILRIREILTPQPSKSAPNGGSSAQGGPAGSAAEVQPQPGRARR